MPENGVRMAFELFDTHCHLNIARHFPDPDAEIARARAAGVTRMALVGIDPPTNESAVEIAARHEGVYAIVGLHPTEAAHFTPQVLGQIEHLLSHPKSVALGEIGLDYHWDDATPEQQKAALHAQLDLAETLNKPVVFHCRKAYDDLLDILEARPPRPYLFHCFSGDAGHADRVKSLDGTIGIDGPITYKKSDDLRAIVHEWPRDRLVLETDSPYLTPEPYRGKPNSPAYVPLINAELARVWGISPDEAAAKTTANAMRFFGLS